MKTFNRRSKINTDSFSAAMIRNIDTSYVIAMSWKFISQ